MRSLAESSLAGCVFFDGDHFLSSDYLFGQWNGGQEMYKL